jgi:hypothetical protein
MTIRAITAYNYFLTTVVLFSWSFLSTIVLADVVVDNGDAGTVSTGTWRISDGSTPYGANSRYARPSATYTWRFSGQPAGNYEVLMWWTTYFTRGTTIAVDINATETHNVTVNQQENGGRWNSLGTFAFGTGGSVTITASSDMLPDKSNTVTTCADAVMFRYISDNADSDGDSLPDDWEIHYFGDLNHDCNSDSNGDGVHDCIEYKLGRDPNATDSKGPGIYYEYDSIGRMIKIERIPSR